MHRSQRFGCLVYPLVLFFFYAAPGLIAQNAPSAPQSTPPETQQQPENPQADQVRLAQQAQARIKARRAARVQRAIQETYSHKFEVYGGGGYLRFRPGSYLQQINETAWNGGFTDYRWNRLGLTGELRGYYGTAYTGNNPYTIFKPSISQYVFLAGPQYRVITHEHWAVSAQVLVGADKGNFNGNSANFPGTLIGLWPNGTTYAVNVAAPFDINISPTLAVRISPNYLLTGFGSTTQVKNLGFTSGLVYRFGRR
jgi:hypothetical protein